LSSFIIPLPTRLQITIYSSLLGLLPALLPYISILPFLLSVFFGALVTVFLLRFSSGLAATLLLWPVITEQIHLSRNVHLDANYACPTAKTGLIGGGAFLSLDSCLFWLVALMLADNAREDHFEENKTFEDASVAI